MDENGWALVALAEGETLFGLALRYDTTAEALKRANAMLDNNLDLRDGAPPRPSLQGHKHGPRHRVPDEEN